jgi:hypothetical protein
MLGRVRYSSVIVIAALLKFISLMEASSAAAAVTLLSQADNAANASALSYKLKGCSSSLNTSHACQSKTAIALKLV